MADSNLELALKVKAVFEGQQALTDLTRGFVDVNSKIETLVRGLTAISGSTEEAAKEFAYIQGIADKFGLRILDLSDNYVKFAASAKGTALEGESARKVFESVASAMAVLGGDTVTTHRAFTALSQVMSKGQVYAEELKGQLAEAIPGAIQIMSRALNIGANDLNKLMKSGQLSSEVLLPFAVQLEKEYGKLSSGSSTFNQEISRLKNTMTGVAIEFEKSTGAFAALKTAIAWLADNGKLIGDTINTGLVVSMAKLAQSTISVTAATYENVRASIANQASLKATTADAANTAAAQEFLARANLSRAQSELASAQGALRTAEANVASARTANAAAIAAAQLRAAQEGVAAATVRAAAANAAVTESTIAATAAQKAATAAASAWSRAMSFLMGPGGLILAGVAALTYFITTSKNATASTEDLAASTEDYAKKLALMSDSQRKAAEASISNSLDDQRDSVNSLAEEVEYLTRKMNEGHETISGNVLAGDFRLFIDVANELAIKRGLLDEETAKLTVTEEKLALAMDRSGVSNEESNRRLGESAEAIKTKVGKLLELSKAIDDSESSLKQSIIQQEIEIAAIKKSADMYALKAKLSEDALDQKNAEINLSKVSVDSANSEMSVQLKRLEVEQNRLALMRENAAASTLNIEKVNKEIASQELVISGIEKEVAARQFLIDKAEIEAAAVIGASKVIIDSIQKQNDAEGSVRQQRQLTIDQIDSYKKSLDDVTLSHKEGLATDAQLIEAQLSYNQALSQYIEQEDQYISSMESRNKTEQDSLAISVESLRIQSEQAAANKDAIESSNLLISANQLEIENSKRLIEMRNEERDALELKLEATIRQAEADGVILTNEAAKIDIIRNLIAEKENEIAVINNTITSKQLESDIIADSIEQQSKENEERRVNEEQLLTTQEALLKSQLARKAELDAIAAQVDALKEESSVRSAMESLYQRTLAAQVTIVSSMKSVADARKDSIESERLSIDLTELSTKAAQASADEKRAQAESVLKLADAQEFQLETEGLLTESAQNQINVSRESANVLLQEADAIESKIAMSKDIVEIEKENALAIQQTLEIEKARIALVADREAAVELVKREASEQESLNEIQRQSLSVEQLLLNAKLELAEATGDEVEIESARNEVIENGLAIQEQVVDSKLSQVRSIEQLISALNDQYYIDGEISAKEQQSLDDLARKIELLNIEITSIESVAEVEAKKAEVISESILLMEEEANAAKKLNEIEQERKDIFNEELASRQAQIDSIELQSVATNTLIDLQGRKLNADQQQIEAIKSVAVALQDKNNIEEQSIALLNNYIEQSDLEIAKLREQAESTLNLADAKENELSFRGLLNEENIRSLELQRLSAEVLLQEADALESKQSAMLEVMEIERSRAESVSEAKKLELAATEELKQAESERLAVIEEENRVTKERVALFEQFNLLIESIKDENKYRTELFQIQQSSLELDKSLLEAKLSLAEASNKENDAEKLRIELSELNLDLSNNVVESKRREADYTKSLVDILNDQFLIDGEITDQEKSALSVLEGKIDLLEKEANTIEQTIAITEKIKEANLSAIEIKDREIAALKESNDIRQAEVDSINNRVSSIKEEMALLDESVSLKQKSLSIESGVLDAINKVAVARNDGNEVIDNSIKQEQILIDSSELLVSAKRSEAEQIRDLADATEQQLLISGELTYQQITNLELQRESADILDKEASAIEYKLSLNEELLQAEQEQKIILEESAAATKALADAENERLAKINELQNIVDILQKESDIRKDLSSIARDSLAIDIDVLNSKLELAKANQDNNAALEIQLEIDEKSMLLSKNLSASKSEEASAIREKANALLEQYEASGQLNEQTEASIDVMLRRADLLDKEAESISIQKQLTIESAEAVNTSKQASIEMQAVEKERLDVLRQTEEAIKLEQASLESVTQSFVDLSNAEQAEIELSKESLNNIKSYNDQLKSKLSIVSENAELTRQSTLDDAVHRESIGQSERASLLYRDAIKSYSDSLSDAGNALQANLVSLESERDALEDVKDSLEERLATERRIASQLLIKSGFVGELNDAEQKQLELSLQTISSLNDQIESTDNLISSKKIEISNNELLIESNTRLAASYKELGISAPESFANIAIKAKAAYDEIEYSQKNTLEKIGSGMVEFYNTVSTMSSEVVRYLTSSKPYFEAIEEFFSGNNIPIDTQRDAFLSYAESALLAAKATNQIIDPSVRLKAESLGLVNTFDELSRKTQRQNLEYEALSNKIDRVIQQKKLFAETVKSGLSAIESEIEAQTSYFNLIGDYEKGIQSVIANERIRIEVAREEATVQKESAAAALEKYNQLELLRSSGQKLSDEQKESLELAKQDAIQKSDSAAKSAALVAKLEVEAASYVAVASKINEAIRAQLVDNELRIESIQLRSGEISAQKQSIEAIDKLNVVRGNEEKIIDLTLQGIANSIELSVEEANKKAEAATAASQYVEQLKSSKTQIELLNPVVQQEIANAELAAEMAEKQARNSLALAEAKRAELIAIQLAAIEAGLSVDEYLKIDAALKSLGLNIREVFVGMDVEFEKSINALAEIGNTAGISAKEIQLAFTDVLAKANTEAELKALETQLIVLGSQGKISGDQLAQSLAAVNTKAVELRAAVGPLQIAMEKLGVGVPEKLLAAANEAEKFYLTIKNSKAPVDEVQQAFLQYAEKALLAAENGAKVDVAQLKAQASALGLGAAFDELKRKIAESSAEYDAIVTKYDRLNALQEKDIAFSKSLVEVYGEKNQSSITLNENLGKEYALVSDLIKEDQVKIALIKQEVSEKERLLEIDKQKLADLQSLRDKGEQLSAVQKEQLELLERQIPIDEQGIAISKEKVKQAESLALSYQNIAADINRVVAAAEQELNQDNDLLESKSKKLEAEKKLAEASGDTVKAQQIAVEISKVEVEMATNTAIAKRDAAIAAGDYVSKLVEQANADGVVSEEELKAIAVARQLVEAKNNEASAAESTAEALKKNADAAQKTADAEKNLKEAEESRTSAGKAATKTMNDSLAVLEATGGEMDKLTKRFYEQQGAFTQHAKGWDGWAAGTARAAQEVKQAYETQKAAITGMDDALKQFNETGIYNANVQQAMIQAGGDLASQFDLMDQQSFDNLRGSLEQANQKLRDMQQEAQDAADRLAELNAEIAAERGDTATADRLKLELQQRQALADIDAKIREAEMQGNTTLLAALEEQRRKLEELYALKERNLEKDIQSRQEQEQSAKSNTDTSTGLAALADNAERARNAVQGLSGIDLSPLSGQLAGLNATVNGLRSSL